MARELEEATPNNAADVPVADNNDDDHDENEGNNDLEWDSEL